MRWRNRKLWQWTLAGRLGWAWLMPRIVGGDLGGRKEREKEAKRQEDIARQTEESQNILNQFLAQLIPGSEEFNRLQTEGLNLVRQTAGEGDQADLIRQLGGQLVSAQQARIAAGGPATALESRTDLATRRLRELSGFTPEEQAVFSALRGLGLSGEQAPIGSIFAELIARAQDPNRFYKSTLQPQLALLQDAVKARAAQRGILGSGLELENLGRTGSELAIKEAAAQEAFRQNQLANFLGVYGLGQQLRERQLGLEGNLVNLQLGRESNLTGLLERSTGSATENLLELMGARTTRAENLRDVASALREAERQRTESYFYPEVDIQAGPITVGYGGGGKSTFVAAGNAPFQGGLDVSSQLGAQRTPTGGGGQPSPVNQLSLQSSQGSQDDALRLLMQALAGAA